jgi:rhamnulokinase
MDVPVLAGPTEATAMGNALMQLVALGDLSTLSDVRALARRQPTQNFYPRAQEHARWEEQLAYFQTL